jgi:hypothetical protein
VRTRPWLWLPCWDSAYVLGLGLGLGCGVGLWLLCWALTSVLGLGLGFVVLGSCFGVGTDPPSREKLLNWPLPPGAPQKHRKVCSATAAAVRLRRPLRCPLGGALRGHEPQRAQRGGAHPVGAWWPGGRAPLLGPRRRGRGGGTRPPWGRLVESITLQPPRPAGTCSWRFTAGSCACWTPRATWGTTRCAPPSRTAAGPEVRAVVCRGFSVFLLL